MQGELQILRHTSGVGYFLSIPEGVEHKLTREKNFEDGEEIISEGVYEEPTTFLDWDVNAPKVIYRWYANGADAEEWECVAKPVATWNVEGDPSVCSAANPIDSLMVFLSIRLGQMVARGQLRIKNPNHGVYFPVVKSNSFAEATLPVVGAKYVAGQGRAGDMGNLNMEQLGIELSVAAGTPEEASIIGRALGGLRGEVERFLTYLGGYNIEYGGYFEDIASVDPQVFSANITYSVTMFSYNMVSPDYTDPVAGWTILPNVTHRILDDETVELYTVE